MGATLLSNLVSAPGQARDPSSSSRLEILCTNVEQTAVTWHSQGQQFSEDVRGLRWRFVSSSTMNKLSLVETQENKQTNAYDLMT